MNDNPFAELDKDLMKCELKFAGLRLLFLSQVFISEYSLGNLKGWSYSNVLKKSGVENLAKMVASKGKTMLNKRVKKPSVEIVFVNEVHSKHVVDTLTKVFDDFDLLSKGLLVTDPRLMYKNRPVMNAFESSSACIVVMKSLISWLMLIPDFLKSKEDLIRLRDKYSVSILSLCLNCFDSILLIYAVNALYASTKIDKLVLMSDVHKFSRIMTLLGQERGINCFVVQHGATVGEEGYLPILADRIFVWGESSQKWFIERGQLSEKIVITGAPSMDCVVYQNVEDSARTCFPLTELLVVMSEVSRELEFLEAVKEALQLYPSEHMNLRIKLHPGGSRDFTYFVNEVFEDSNIRISVHRFEDIGAMIDNADIVIVTTSSVGMEALIRNKPILQFKSRIHFNHRMKYEDYDCSHVFFTGYQLAMFLKDPEFIYSKISNYRAFIYSYYGILDGLSARRIRDYVVTFGK